MPDAGVFFEFLPMSDFDEARLDQLGPKAVPHLLQYLRVGVMDRTYERVFTNLKSDRAVEVRLDEKRMEEGQGSPSIRLGIHTNRRKAREMTLQQHARVFKSAGGLGGSASPPRLVKTENNVEGSDVLQA